MQWLFSMIEIDLLFVIQEHHKTFIDVHVTIIDLFVGCLLVRYIEAVRRLKAAGQRFARTIHLLFVPGQYTHAVDWSSIHSHCQYTHCSLEFYPRSLSVQVDTIKSLHLDTADQSSTWSNNRLIFVSIFSLYHSFIHIPMSLYLHLEHCSPR